MHMRLTVKPPRLFVWILAAACCLPAAESKPDDAAKAAPPAADLMVGKEPGQVRDDNGLKMKLVWCTPGFVTMESVEDIVDPAAKEGDRPNNDDEVDPIDEPAPEPGQKTKITPVRIFLTQGYWLGKCEVTQSEWKLVMKTEPWKGQRRIKEGADFPATYVSWNHATDFCRILTERERESGRLSDGWEYTLPTDAQWERACRARTETTFSFGDAESKLGEYAWFRDNAWNAGEQYAHRVGQKKPNPWGLCDMHGNVWEWCRDVYTGTQNVPGGRDPEAKPVEKTDGSFRVIRGAGWINFAAYCRSAIRSGASISDRDSLTGFRVALSSAR